MSNATIFARLYDIALEGRKGYAPVLQLCCTLREQEVQVTEYSLSESNCEEVDSPIDLTGKFSTLQPAYAFQCCLP
jgi:hypothetical protein